MRRKPHYGAAPTNWSPPASDPDNIAAPRAWEEYHGAFDQWIRAGTPGLTAPRGTLPKDYDPFHDPFYKWLWMRDSKASYHGGLYPHPPDEWNTLSAYGYRSMFFHRNFAWVLKRGPGRKP